MIVTRLQEILDTTRVQFCSLCSTQLTHAVRIGTTSKKILGITYCQLSVVFLIRNPLIRTSLFSRPKKIRDFKHFIEWFVKNGKDKNAKRVVSNKKYN